jgi:Contact-dependent growth inhibition CdiA C-terminal domain
VIDERGKRFSPAERRIAEFLARPGPAVVSVAEGYGVYGRTPDARVNDIPVEFKSLDPGATVPSKAALNSAKGPARLAVIDARGSGLAEDVANRGIRRFSGTPHGDRLDAVLVIGDNCNIDWRRTG